MFDFNSPHLGIVPSSGNYGTEWPQNFVIPQGQQGSLSVGGWTIGNEGFPQQTFLGASIRDFSISAGFGDSVSNVSINLVNDEYNPSDGLFLGSGDDPYHDGKNDLFRPPAVGSPVFFKFGKNPATVEQAWRKTFDDTYNVETLPDNPVFPEYTLEKPIETLPIFNFVDLAKSTDTTFHVVDKSSLLNPYNEIRGWNHFVFGGILQSYTENTSQAGHSLYNVNVVDPREILSDCVILFNNYQGTTFNNKNLFNVYGFLEYDPSDELSEWFDENSVDKAYLTKFVDSSGVVTYEGNASTSISGVKNPIVDQYEFPSEGGKNVTSSLTALDNPDQAKIARYFPITGQGLSRRTDKGIPYYRVSQGLATMFEYYGGLPKEYIDAGFGGRINFRGFNYVVDFGGIPLEKIPYMYFLDFDQLDMLSFAQELCDIISHDLFVSLLPVIDHPACAFLEKQNVKLAAEKKFNQMTVGIIRLDAIDRSVQPKYGAIVEYLAELKSQNVEIENQDIGFELSNVPTDKFVVGAQEVEMYYFDTTNDRDELQVLREGDGQQALEILQQEQWLLQTNLKQQLIPFYGFLGESKAVSVPRGWGAYQQILLDATQLNAFGVGNYYVATELELRAALVSFDRWKNFLLKYNETYIQDTDEYNATFSALSLQNDQINDVLDDFVGKTGLTEDTPLGSGILNQLKNRDFAVTVPRCVWDSDRPYMAEDGLPASPCSPPYGYPLYYKRAQKIGIPEAGVNKIINAKTKAIKNSTLLRDKLNGAAQFSHIGTESIEQKAKLLISKITTYEEDWREAHPEDQGGYAEQEDYIAYIQQYERLVEAAEEYEAIRNRLIKDGEDLIADTMNTLEGLAENPMIAMLPSIAKQHLANAKKVYEFVKKVAEENLGKKFLVKIPKACNALYQPNIVTYDSDKTRKHIAAGPFGFSPTPPGSGTDIIQQGKFQNRMEEIQETIKEEDLFKHYLNYKIDVYDSGTKADVPSEQGSENNKHGEEYFTYGALKNNYNPIDEKWEFNYKPEPQGGFFNYTLFPSRIDSEEKVLYKVSDTKMPTGISQALIPEDPQKLMSSKGRISCYARYNHSHFLNFTNVPAESLSQQSMDSNGIDYIPDIVQQLPNVRPDQDFSFNLEQERKKEDKKELRQPPSVAFVKCDIDEQFYMPPKLEEKSKLIFAREYQLNISTPPVDIKETKDEDGCPTYEFVVNRIDPVFSIPSGGGCDDKETTHTDFVRKWDETLKGYIVDTRVRNQDPDHVYALITVPGRIETTLDQRWADGPQQVNNTVEIKNLMTQDVVKITDFNKPSFPDKTDRVIDCEKDELDFSLAQLTEVERIQRQALKGVKFNQGETAVQFIQPSPIYPNMVAIPLLSWERCYGPWMSATQINMVDRKRFSNIGGKIEFLKDENLAPWNFAGYQLMNEAGKLQAEFSNSLLLISERGGFVYPAAPSGIGLAKALKAGGPLVTSINVQVGDSIRTTVKLDLYTSSFGKLQKQKENNIATIARERQKIIDQNNNAIRRGLGKSQTSSDLLGGIMENGGKKILQMAKDLDTFFDDVDRESASRMILSSDGRQTSLAEEQRIMRGMESYNNYAQTINALSPGGGVLPVVDMGDIFEIVNADYITSTQNPIPGMDFNSNDAFRGSIARRFFGFGNEGDN